MMLVLVTRQEIQEFLVLRNSRLPHLREIRWVIFFRLSNKQDSLVEVIAEELDIFPQRAFFINQN